MSLHSFVALISKWHRVVLGIILRGGKPVFPPSPGADAETLGETVEAFSRPARALALGEGLELFKHGLVLKQYWFLSF